MAELPDGCNFGIVPNPCEFTTESGRAQNRNTDAIIRALKNFCEVIDGSDPDNPPDPPVPPGGLFGNLLIRFRLTSTLVRGSNAAAVMIDWDGAAWVTGAAITVYDDEENGGSWQGIAGYTGWARRAEAESARFPIVRMQRIAYVVRGTLISSLSGGSATLSVANYSDGVNPGVAVAVHDPNGRWPKSVAGGTAIALYNFDLSRYEVVQAEQSEWIAEATATMDYGPTTTYVTISGPVFKTQQEYMPDPETPTQARNKYGLSGSLGDTLLIHRSKDSDEWEIVTGGNPGGTSSSAAVPVHRFRLTGSLKLGENASAKRLSFNGLNYVEQETIVVWDRPYPATAATPGMERGMWSGIASMEGYARKREVKQLGGDDEYEIIWMEQFGRFIYFTLTSDMAANEATATIDYMFGQGDAVTTETITVHDDHDLFTFAKAGGKGFAVRNEYLGTDTPETPYYQVVVVQQLMLYTQAQLANDMCPGDVTGRVMNLQTPWSPTIYNLPLVFEGSDFLAANRFDLAGTAGDVVLIVGDYSDPEIVVWQIVQVQHHDQQIITQLRFNQANKCIEYKSIEHAAVMRCGGESDWTILLCGEECQTS